MERRNMDIRLHLRNGVQLVEFPARIFLSVPRRVGPLRENIPRGHGNEPGIGRILFHPGPDGFACLAPLRFEELTCKMQFPNKDKWSRIWLGLAIVFTISLVVLAMLATRH